MNPEHPALIVTPPSQLEPPPAETVKPPPTPSPEEIRAADAVFAEQKDGAVVSGMFGLWSGALLLNDLAKEQFSEEEDEEEEENEEEKPRKIE
jgi:hypothetical protein